MSSNARNCSFQRASVLADWKSLPLHIQNASGWFQFKVRAIDLRSMPDFRFRPVQSWFPSHFVISFLPIILATDFAKYPPNFRLPSSTHLTETHSILDNFVVPYWRTAGDDIAVFALGPQHFEVKPLTCFSWKLKTTMVLQRRVFVAEVFRTTHSSICPFLSTRIGIEKRHPLNSILIFEYILDFDARCIPARNTVWN